MAQLSDRLNRLAPSATLAMSQKSSEMKAQGVDVINMSVGEPELMTISQSILQYQATQLLGMPSQRNLKQKTALTMPLRRLLWVQEANKEYAMPSWRW